MKELIFEKVFKKDDLLEFLKSRVDFLSDENNSIIKKCDKESLDEEINAYKYFSELAKEDESSTEYRVKVFKEKDGDMTTYSTNIKEL